MINRQIDLIKYREYVSVKNILFVFLLSVEMYIIADVIVTFSFSLQLPSFISLISFIAVFLLLFFFRISLKKLFVLVVFVPLLISVIVSVLYFSIYIPFQNNSNYSDLSSNSNIFVNKRVMVIVPHQDDDINIVGGMIDNYVKNGSEIFPVFVTNGDAEGLTKIRFNEAIECWKKIGVPESNLVFLGYGDTWNDNGPHIYNSEGDKICISSIGKERTYGTKEHPAFNDGTLYTFNNFKNDFISVIKYYKPDVLFVSDYDEHQDHKAVSLMFEKAMVTILKEGNNYFPIVYKAYAYSTAWCSNDDFYSLNIKKTSKPDDVNYCPMVYNWENRVRFPVYSANLSRSIFTSSIYEELSIYKSQYANSVAKNIINGDKVFWQRRTDSILYNADVKTSSGSSKCINDYNILDSDNIKKYSKLPYDGVWTPDKVDKNKSIQFLLKENSDISYIYFYDHPSLTENVKEIQIEFDDGDVIKSNSICKNGAASKICVNKKGVASFTVKITDYEGNNPSVSEIEAFNRIEQKDATFIKLQDNNKDFVYDYIADDKTELSIYSNNSVPDLSSEYYTVSCNNIKCKCEIKNKKLYVYCPENESCLVTVKMNSCEISDTVMIHNVNWIEKVKIMIGQAIENKYIYPISQAHYYNLTFYRFFHDIKSMF